VVTDLIGTEHGSLVVLRHSTGGLVASLWAARNSDRVDALVLNSPWLDLPGSGWRVGLRPATQAVTLPPIRMGWLRAVRRGQARVSAGLRLPMPVLVLLSALPAREQLFSEIARWLSAYGPAPHRLALPSTALDQVSATPQGWRPGRTFASVVVSTGQPKIEVRSDPGQRGLNHCLDSGARSASASWAWSRCRLRRCLAVGFGS
jgi:pimeloyl-ACP methyl ester carboxylesterase